MGKLRPWNTKQLRAAALLSLCAAAPAHAVNLLLNPGFEAPPDPNPINSNVAGWTLVNDCQRASFNNHTPGGQYHLWAKTWQPVGGGAYQDVGSITVGATYTLSSWMFFENGFVTVTDPLTAQLGLTFFNSSNQQVGSPTFLNISPQASPPVDVYTNFDIQAVAPTGASYVRAFLGWDGGGSGVGAQSVFFDDAILDGPGVPPSNSTWITNGSGNWHTSANWANGVVPNSVGANAEFFSAITGPQTIYANVATTAGTLNFNNANTYVIAGAGSLTLQVASGNANVIVQSGSHKINLPLTIASDTTLNVSNGATLKISDPMIVNAGRTVTQTGGGQVNYESTVSVLAGANLQMGSSSRMAALSLASNANATLTTGGSKMIHTDALSVNASGRLDLTDNDMIVGASSYSTIAALVAQARNGGGWDQPGITSSAAASQASSATTLGVLSGTDYMAVNGSPFNGTNVASSDTLVKYTWYGDTDFTGAVDFDDYVRTDSGFNNGQSGWSNGDFDLSGLVDFDDYVLIDLGFNTQSGTLRRAVDYIDGTDRSLAGMDAPALEKVVEHFAQFGTDYGTHFLSAVPEPASAGALAVAGVLALSTRRRRNVA